MNFKNIHQTLVFKTDVLDLYCCIMNARIHSSFTGDEAIIEDKEGTIFSAFGGYITGKNIVLERGKKSSKPGVPKKKAGLPIIFLR